MATERAQALVDAALAAPHIRMAAPAAVSAKLATFLLLGRDSLHVISDFDMTLTKYWVDGKRGPSTHSLLLQSPEINEGFKARTRALYEKYYPMEISPTLSREEKVEAMVQWWEGAHAEILSLGLTRSELRRHVSKAHATFRPGATDLFKLCEGAGVPLVVFSAGLADVIEDVLDARGVRGSTVHVVSNRMDWDGERCKGFVPPLIHVFNKSEACGVRGTEHEAAVAGRKCVILLGDSLGDLDMAGGVEKGTTVLNIGFLNHDVETLRDRYMAAFDIVVEGDADMNLVIELVQSIIQA